MLRDHKQFGCLPKGCRVESYQLEPRRGASLRLYRRRAIGRLVRLLAPSDLLNEMPEILSKIRSGQRVDHYETRRRAKNGEILDVSLTISPMRDASRPIIGASRIARDITFKKRAEAERALLLAREHEARQLAESSQTELRRWNEELRRVNQDLETFAYSASHDLQEPLRTVGLCAQLLERNLSNLISNALKYCQEAPRVHVSAARRNGSRIISVADNGIGIDPQYTDQIFCIFKRLHGRDAYEGSGVGLAICQRIVQQYGGRIWLEKSAPSAGSTFCFRFPQPA
jgi:signal transduction histidine kinase